MRRNCSAPLTAFATSWSYAALHLPLTSLLTPHSMSEGSLEAPTRHEIDWKSPDYYDEGKLFEELERVYDICHGCRRCVSLCTSFPDPVRPGRFQRDAGGGRGQEGGLLEGRRPVLPLRPVLHDQVPLRSAAPLERRLPAPDAAGQGGEVQEGRDQSARQAAVQHRRAGQARLDPGGRADGQCGQPYPGRPHADGKLAGHRQGARAA